MIAEILTEAQWKAGAEAFGISDAELQEYKLAFDDLFTLGVFDFVNHVEAEARVALANAPAAEATVRRLVVRNNVVQVALETFTQGAMLHAYDGPVH